MITYTDEGSRNKSNVTSREPSTNARWYYEDENQILNHDHADFPRSILLIVTVRLGMSSIEPEFFDSIKACFHLPQCVGILGGKPNFALYFVGYQDNHLIFLDPHFVQDSVKSVDQLPSMLHTFYSSQQRTAKKIKLDSLDPCLGLGLLIRNGKDLRDLKEAFITGPLSNLATLYEKKD